MSTWILEAEIAIVLAVIALPIAIFPLVYLHYRRFGRFSGWQAFLTIATFLYVCGLIAFTLFPLPETNDQFCTLREEISYWQLTPFASLGGILDEVRSVGIISTLTGPIFLQVFFNVVLLAPLGFLLAYRYRRGFGATVLVGLATSTLIEVTQGTGVWGAFGCPYRLADVDDLITNTAGAGIGWLIGSALSTVLPDPDPPFDPDVDAPSIRRRVSAGLLDLLAVLVLGFILQVGLILGASAMAGEGYEDRPWFDPTAVVVGTVVPILLIVLVVPAIRRDRASVGQVTTWLALRSDGASPDARAVMARFAVRWLPVVVVALWQPLLALLVVAVIESVTVAVRSDRRSLSGVAARTQTVTARSLTR